VTANSPPQLVRGSLAPTSSVQPCILVSPTWCAWYCLLGTFNLRVLELYGPLHCPWVQQTVTTSAIDTGALWSDFPMPDSALHTHSSLVVLIHGPVSTLEYFSREMFRRQRILYLAPSGFSTPMLPFSARVSHFEAGGVLKGSWSFVSNSPFGVVTPSPSRKPRQLIKRTNNIKCRIPEGATVLEDLEAPFPMDCYKSPVRCPTVYGADHFVTRWLTLGELLTFFDVPSVAIPPLVQSLLQRHVPAANVKDYPFLTEVPLKVLHKIYEMWNEVPYSLSANPPPLGYSANMDVPGHYV
jgi:hypothetical protein